MVLSLSIADAYAEVAITTCGQTVPAKEVGVLQQDLACPVAPATAGVCAADGAPCVDDVDCPAFAQICLHPAAVILESGATLRLGGFSISDGDVGVDCRRAGTHGCQIEGPGTIASALRYGVLIAAGGRYSIAGLTLDGNRTGIGSLFAVVPATKRLKMILADLTISNSAFGGIVLGPPTAASLKGTDLTITNNGFGISIDQFVSATPTLRRGAQAKLIRLVATGNGSFGVYADKLTLIDSDVSATGPLGNADVFTFRKPHLRNSTCGRSVRLIDGVGGSGTWGVCAGD
jgi:hypothetical protein